MRLKPKFYFYEKVFFIPASVLILTSFSKNDEQTSLDKTAAIERKYPKVILEEVKGKLPDGVVPKVIETDEEYENYLKNFPLKIVIDGAKGTQTITTSIGMHTEKVNIVKKSILSEKKMSGGDDDLPVANFTQSESYSTGDSQTGYCPVYLITSISNLTHSGSMSCPHRQTTAIPRPAWCMFLTGQVQVYIMGYKWFLLL